MKPMKLMQTLGGFTLLIWLIGAVIAGLANNFRDRQHCIERDGWFKGSLSCSNVSQLGFGANMLLGASWPIAFVRSAVAQNEPIPPTTVTQEEFEKSSVGVMYTCLAIAIGARNNEDANLLLGMINAMNTKFESAKKQHDDFMKLAARASANLESSGLANKFYEEGCKRPIANMRQLTVTKE
jgi:hypothetical protein